MTPDNLKAWRARLSLGEAGMAAYLGVPVTTYRKWENGTRKPDAAPLRLFAVLQAVEREAVTLHLNLLSDAQDTENKPTKARKPRAATLAPATPEKRPSGPVFSPSAAPSWGSCGREQAAPPVPPWVQAADALPAWMIGAPHA